MFATARLNECWQVAMYCAGTAAGTGCRSCEIRGLRIGDIHVEAGQISIRGEVAKNRSEREPRLMALAKWGLKNLLERARKLGATEAHHYLYYISITAGSHKVQNSFQDKAPTMGCESAHAELGEVLEEAYGSLWHDWLSLS